MTAGELVVNIVLKGGEKAKQTFEGLNKGVKSVASSSLEAKAALVGAVYALDRLISSAGQQGSTLTNFVNLTNQSAESLQRWKLAFQHTGGAAEEMQGQITSVYSALARQNAGLGAIAGFGFVNQHMHMDMARIRNNDVFYLMEQLRQFANTGAGKSGVGNEMLQTFVSANTIAGFRNKDFDPSKVSKGLLIGEKEQKGLNAMNIALNDFWTNLKRFGTVQTEIFGPDVIKNLNGALSTITKLTTAFDKWAKHNGELATLATILGTMAAAFVLMGGPLSLITGAVGSLIWLAAQWDKHSKGQDNIFGDKNFKGNIAEKSAAAFKGSYNEKGGFWNEFFSLHAQPSYQPSAEQLEEANRNMHNNWLFKAIHGSKNPPASQKVPSTQGGKSAQISIHNYGVEDDTLASTVLDTVNRQMVRGPYFQSGSLVQVS